MHVCFFSVLGFIVVSSWFFGFIFEASPGDVFDFLFTFFLYSAPWKCSTHGILWAFDLKLKRIYDAFFPSKVSNCIFLDRVRSTMYVHYLPFLFTDCLREEASDSELMVSNLAALCATQETAASPDSGSSLNSWPLIFMCLSLCMGCVHLFLSHC